MVGLVIVSHSARLADGVYELARQMAGDQVPLAVAGGLDDPEQSLGTDPLRVQAAIEAVYSEAGVVVLMDLGSALLSAEMALEFLPEDWRAHIHLCPAPLVEGAIAAVSRARAGGEIGEVLAEAQAALEAKAAQLAPSLPEDLPAADTPSKETLPSDQMVRLTIENPHGLHARPAAALIQAAADFQAQIRLRDLTTNSDWVDVRSLNRLLTLGVRQGHQLELAAVGPDAAIALAALQECLQQTPAPPVPTEPPAPTSSLTSQTLTGLPVSPGVAIGPLIPYRPRQVTIDRYHSDDPAAELRRLQAALVATRQDLTGRRDRLRGRTAGDEGEIFNAQRLFLDDPALLEAAERYIRTDHATAEAAWQKTLAAQLATYEQLDDPYLRERGTDLYDVGQQVLIHLIGQPGISVELSQPGIIVAENLTPSDIDRLDPKQVLGLATAGGSTTSHSAILARALGIPAVMAAGPALTRLPEGTIVALDGQSGQIWPDPAPERLAALEAKRRAWLAQQQALLANAAQPARTRDGRRIVLMANLRGLSDARTALEYGAEGVGVLRTEFLYLNRATAPTEDEQVAAYRAIAGRLQGRPLIVRTLDIGGDKPLPYLVIEPEENPFLGWRGLRISLAEPAMFKTQLRAILRAAADYPLKILLPMVSLPQEIASARALLTETQAELRQAGHPFASEIDMGAMVEVPAAVALAEQLAAVVDFLSIGTNDLSQYTLAADRTNPRVAPLADALHPAVLRLVRQTVDAGHAAGLEVALCGELAAEALAAPVLVGLDLDELSMNTPAIPPVKAAIAQITAAEAEEAAAAALQLDSAQAVRDYLRKRFPDL